MTRKPQDLQSLWDDVIGAQEKLSRSQEGLRVALSRLDVWIDQNKPRSKEQS